MKHIKFKESLVSIILPVNQAEKTLSACLESLLSQTHTNIEIIAIDDNSKDKSFKILKKYRQMDKRLIISRNVKKYGLTITLNRSLKKARGKYIAFMNAKDISTPDRVKRQLLYLKRHPKISAVGTQVTYINDKGKKMERSEFPTDSAIIQRTLLNKNVMQLESMMINRYLLPKDLLKFDYIKYPLLYRALAVKIINYGKVANLNQALYLRRIHDEWNLDELSNHLFTHISLWLKARFVYDARPSINSLLYPLNNRLKGFSA